MKYGSMILGSEISKACSKGEKKKSQGGAKAIGVAKTE